MGNMIFLVNTTQLRENIELLFSATLGGFNNTGELLGELFAAAKSLQSCPTLCDLIDGSPPGSVVLGILQARTLEWGAIAFSEESCLGCRKKNGRISILER